MARALYIHWPFCLAKCPYCDFNSHVRDRVDIEAWTQGLLADMRHEAQHAGDEPLRSVFFGGGTPSLMPPALVTRLLEEAQTLWGFADGIEITLEANPSSVEAANFSELGRAGVNRVSLGIQALDDGALRFLGRLHDADAALDALAKAQRAFDQVSFDLIYARPGQTPESWRDELARALALGTAHLSLYQLTIEPGTRFATEVRRKSFIPLADDRAADLFALTAAMTNDAGMPAYEISNHARPGAQSRHNLTYWRYEDYCGIGPGAHGRRSAMATQRHRKPENWLNAVAGKGSGIEHERRLSRKEQATEALLMGLRLSEGVDAANLGARFGLETMIDEAAFARHREAGLLWQTENRIGLMPHAMVLLDALLAEIVSNDLVSA